MKKNSCTFDAFYNVAWLSQYRADGKGTNRGLKRRI